MSGGLDSCLAVLLLREQGIEVEAVNFTTPFSQSDGKDPDESDASRLSAQMNVVLRRIPLGNELFEIVERPKHGWGRNMNPCIDCHALMLRRAKACMRELGASFVATGEVVGQRPFSQHLKALSVVEKEGGLEGLVLRPLSARHLKPTVPEERGWVDRERLLGISGRSRKEQLEMARRFGIKDPPASGGGCLLTDPGYSRRLRDALAQRGGITEQLARVLRYGRYFRFPEGALLVVGRNQEDNARLEGLWSRDEWLLEPVDCAGPTALAIGPFPRERLESAAAVVSRYSDKPATGSVEVKARRGTEEIRLEAAPLEPEKAGAVLV